ncbi:Regulator of nonsense transcripts 1 like protein [Fusarium odoratissimum]|uniref:Regulator of nonsense transcripts 1 like protein n=1 Tax=Fusarium oxysporum f. sp. cubense (strain race 4) TaxID=2502994 RepID=N1R693_FUSC4|nr:Regulator of nonsense transcripts 1 like protein [Fusarium odoratissimum]
MSQQQKVGSSASGQKKGKTSIPSPTPAPAPLRSSSKECVVFSSGLLGSVIASSNKTYGTSRKLGAKFFAVRREDESSWLGFEVTFPIGQGQIDNENLGFGVKHAVDFQYRRPVASDVHSIWVKFPRDGLKLSAEDASESLLARFPGRNKNHKQSLVTVSTKTAATIVGFGVPFLSSDAEVNGWVNDNMPIADGVDLQSFLRQDTFTFLVPQRPSDVVEAFGVETLGPVFRYPYSEDQSWDENRLGQEARSIKGRQFGGQFWHPNDLSHVTAVVQGTAQDVMWLNDRREEIAEMRLPAYFVTPPNGNIERSSSFLVIIAMTMETRKSIDAAWRRLSKDEFPKIRLFNSPENEAHHDVWEGKIMSRPNGIPELNDHPTEAFELVFDPILKDHKRKVMAANLFLPSADPTNFAEFGLPCDPDNTKSMMDEKDMTDQQKFVLSQVRDWMALHRALLRGEGFYEWMSKPAPRPIEEALEAMTIEDAAPTLRSLPVVNFLEDADEAYANAIVDEALPQDRDRFRYYLENRPLGLGIITAGPGFGKTTAGAAAILAMQSQYGRVFCSAPTNVAVNNVAVRIDLRSRAVTERCNVGKQVGGPTERVRRRLVVRCYKDKHEEEAFRSILEDTSLGDGAAPVLKGRRLSPWRLQQSSTYWLLILLRSPAVRPLHQDDAAILHRWQQAIDKDDGLFALRAVATREMSWKDFLRSKEFSDCMESANGYLKDFPRVADILSNMTRADLLCVWGNTLSPCFVFGDPKQLPPAVIMLNDTWPKKDKNSPPEFINRFGLDGKISALEYLQGSGIPTYRLKMQLRMAQGMFDTVSSVIYPDVPFVYDESRSITFSEFKIGHDLESFTRARYPDLAASASGTLTPIFIHCEGARVIRDMTSGAKWSFGQVEVALDFILDLVVDKKIDPARISVIAPYPANVNLINGVRRRSKYATALEKLPRAATIDSSQGQENDLVVAVVGTDEASGPGFTADPQRLNVMLTRAKSGLVLVGNIHVADAVPKVVEKKGKKGKEKEPTFEVITIGGAKAIIKAPELRKFYKGLHDSGRVARVVVKNKIKDRGKGKEEEVKEEEIKATEASEEALPVEEE